MTIFAVFRLFESCPGNTVGPTTLLDVSGIPHKQVDVEGWVGLFEVVVELDESLLNRQISSLNHLVFNLFNKFIILDLLRLFAAIKNVNFVLG